MKSPFYPHLLPFANRLQCFFPISHFFLWEGRRRRALGGRRPPRGAGAEPLPEAVRARRQEDAEPLDFALWLVFPNADPRNLEACFAASGPDFHATM